MKIFKLNRLYKKSVIFLSRHSLPIAVTTIFLAGISLTFYVGLLFQSWPFFILGLLLTLSLMLFIRWQILSKQKIKEDFDIKTAELIREVDQRKRTEHHLVESELRYRSITTDVFNTSAVGFFIVDKNFKIIWMNKTLEDYFGLSKENFIGQDKRRAIKEKIKFLFEDGSTFAQEVLSNYENNHYFTALACHLLPGPNRQERWLAHWSQPIKTGLYAGGRVEQYTDITEIKKAQRRLQESEEKHRRIFESLQDLYYQVDDQGIIRNLSPSVKELTGYEPDELIGKPALNVYFNPQDRGEFLQALQRQGQVRNYNLRLVKKSGEVVDTAVSAHFIYDDKKNVVGIEGTMRDITEMKKAQDKIDHLNKVLSAIINIDKIIMRGRNIKKSMQQICDALVKTRGYTSVFVVLYDQNQKIEDYFQTNLGGDNFKNFISYLNGKQVPLCAKKALEEGGIHIIDSRNQEEFCSGCPLVDNCPRENILIARLEYENVIYGLLSVSLYEFHQEQSDIDLFRDFITDISFALHYSNIAQERKVFQKKLLASEREYRELVEGANSIILKMDRDGKVIFFNKFAQNFFGYSQQEIIGRNVLGTIIPEVESFSQRDLRGLIKDIIQRPQDYKYHENENVLRNGRRVWVAWSNQVLYDDNKEAVEILSFGRDITEEKKIKEKLKESMKLKSKFISAVSHELRTPMTAIKEGIDIVFDGSAGDINPEQKEFLSLAKRNVDRLSRLVNDVLDFQKLESGRMDFDFQQNNINKLIEEVYKVMQPLARDKKIDFSTDCQQGLPVLKFDWDRIMQVVINLVNNSLKFTDKGYIKISSRHRGNTIIVSVADSGIGIKQEDRDKLFKTFSQIASGGMRKTGGTGLGLAISKEIIYRHRGKIWVESEYGNGSTFSFLLPIKEKRGLR